MGKQPSIPTGEECNRVVMEKEAGPTTQTHHPGFKYIFSSITGRLQIFTETTKPPAMLIPQTAMSPEF